MAYLAQHTSVLTAEKAAHLLRRATAGPTKAEITSFTGKTPMQAYLDLFNNINYNPSPPIILDATSAYYQQTYVTGAFVEAENFDRGTFIKYWWLAQMTRQDTAPSLLEKLALFWQNHFVSTREIVSDYRFVWRYLNTIRQGSLGNFKTLVKNITKDPMMLLYLNGNENIKGSPNENYGRELQELFTVGERDFAGNLNYTENDVKAAAEVLTGWDQYHYWYDEPTHTFGTEFKILNHETGNKTFSAKYNNTVITGRNTTNAGDLELNDLVNMLMAHPEAPKFICRKLYKWYVNPTVTQDIETNVIIPLADFFKSPANDFAIEPVLRKLLTSDIFYDIDNIGAVIKSPLELAIGSLRFFNMQVPNMATDTQAFKKYFNFAAWQMLTMQMNIIDQSSVFGYEPYYQNALSRAWISSNTIAVRNSFTDQYAWAWAEIGTNRNLGIKLVDWAKTLQPNLTDTVGTPAITAVDVLNAFSDKMFVTPLFQAQKDFLIDTIMLGGLNRINWVNEWNAFRRVANTPTDPTYKDKYDTVNWRLILIMRFMLKMAEFHVF